MASFYISKRVLYAEGIEPGSIADSVKKWELIRDHITEISDLNDVQTCALCLDYNNLDKESNPDYLCTRCPVFKKTSYRYCAGTPYSKFIRAFQHLNADNPEERKAIEQFASEEIEFLKSLEE